MPHFIQSEGPSIQERGREAIKEAHPIFLMLSDAPFTVSTNEGTLSGNAGDYVAYDPMSGHLWPVSAEYVDMHYVFTDEGELDRTLSQRLQEAEQARTHLEEENALLQQRLTDLEQAHTQLVAEQEAQANSMVPPEIPEPDSDMEG